MRVSMKNHLHGSFSGKIEMKQFLPKCNTIQGNWINKGVKFQMAFFDVFWIFLNSKIDSYMVSWNRFGMYPMVTWKWKKQKGSRWSMQ